MVRPSFDSEPNSPLYDEIKVALADYLVGFLKLSVSAGVQKADCAGSGTLVRFNDIFGVLTAAHVVDSLPTSGIVGLLRFPTTGTQRQRLTVDMSGTRRVVFDSNPFSETGPDLALLTLPEDTVQTLKAYNTFFNLQKGEIAFTSNAWLNRPYCDVAVGVIDERTQILPPDPHFERTLACEASVEPGETLKLEPFKEMDRYQFHLNHDVNYTPPRSYAGMSGGGLWRIRIGDCKDLDKGKIDNLFLMGVVYYQTELKDGRRTLICHGPSSIYESLMTQMCKTLT